MLAGIDESPKKCQNDPGKADLNQAMRRIGELTMENDLLWQRARKPGSLAKGRSTKGVLRSPLVRASLTESSGSVMSGSRFASHSIMLHAKFLRRLANVVGQSRQDWPENRPAA